MWEEPSVSEENDAVWLGKLECESFRLNIAALG